MTDDVKTELAAIRERYEAATEGPWRADGLEGNLDSPRSRVAEVYMWLEDDAHFIAHARTDVPRLVAALEAVLELRNRIARSGFEALTRDSMERSLDAALGRLTVAPKEARLTARDHCDSGCINPGSGDCPTCKAAACGLPQVATQEPEVALSGAIRTGGSSGVEVDAEGTWYYDTEAGIRMPYADYVAVTSPLKLHILATRCRNEGGGTNG